jgi:hypothetical protein
MANLINLDFWQIIQHPVIASTIASFIVLIIASIVPIARKWLFNAAKWILRNVIIKFFKLLFYRFRQIIYSIIGLDEQIEKRVRELELITWNGKVDNTPPANIWTPIGTQIITNAGLNEKLFNGNFDGNGYVISGVYINSTNGNNQELFCWPGYRNGR